MMASSNSKTFYTVIRVAIIFERSWIMCAFAWIMKEAVARIPTESWHSNRAKWMRRKDWEKNCARSASMFLGIQQVQPRSTFQKPNKEFSFPPSQYEFLQQYARNFFWHMSKIESFTIPLETLPLLTPFTSFLTLPNCIWSHIRQENFKPAKEWQLLGGLSVFLIENLYSNTKKINAL